MKSDEAHSHKTHGGAYGGEIAPVVTHWRTESIAVKETKEYM